LVDLGKPISAKQITTYFEGIIGSTRDQMLRFESIGDPEADHLSGEDPRFLSVRLQALEREQDSSHIKGIAAEVTRSIDEYFVHSRQ